MLKKTIFISIIITLTFGCRNSKFNENHGVVLEPVSEEEKIEMKIVDLKKGNGVIFSKKYEAGFNKVRLSTRFTPTENEIREAEIEINKPCVGIMVIDTETHQVYPLTFRAFPILQDAVTQPGKPFKEFDLH